MKSAAQVRADFKRRNVNITQWAMKRNFPPQVVLDLLHGRSKGVRGDSYRAAIALGIKDQP